MNTFFQNTTAAPAPLPEWGTRLVDAALKAGETGIRLRDMTDAEYNWIVHRAAKSSFDFTGPFTRVAVPEFIRILKEERP